MELKVKGFTLVRFALVGALAHQEERLLCKQKATGSSPVGSIMWM